MSSFLRRATGILHGALQNLKGLLQLHHQLPVGLHQVVTEVILAGVDRLPRYLHRDVKFSGCKNISFAKCSGTK